MVERIIDQVPELSKQSCYVSEADQPNPARVSEAGFSALVSDGGGTFDDGWLTGGGQNTARLQLDLTVTIWNFNLLDEPQVDEIISTDQRVGLHPLAGKIYKALIDYMLTWSGNDILTDNIIPSRKGRIIRPSNDLPGSMELSFAVNFEWDLS